MSAGTPEGYEDTAFGAENFAALAQAERTNPWFEARNEAIALLLARHFPGASTLLEIGCGTGFVLEHLQATFPGLELTGADAGAAGLEIARKRLDRASLHQLDARRIQLERKFDVVCAFDVIEHIDEDELVLSEMRRVTAPGGGLLVAVPQHPWLWSAADDYGGHKRRYRRAELVAKVRAAGFEELQVTSYVTAALPLMAASRVLSRRQPAAEFDPLAEHRSAQRAKPLLAPLLKADVALIRRGVSLPAGGSVLIAARAA
jgi:SAM-dependent methyltransferase